MTRDEADALQPGAIVMVEGFSPYLGVMVLVERGRQSSVAHVRACDGEVVYFVPVQRLRHPTPEELLTHTVGGGAGGGS